jgi:hypothetical protein
MVRANAGLVDVGAITSPTSAASASSRLAAATPRSPAPKQRGAPPGAPPSLHRTAARVHRHGTAHENVLKLLALFVVFAALAQLLGAGTALQRALQSRCAALVHRFDHGDGSSGPLGSGGSNSHGGGLWGHLCPGESPGAAGASGDATAGESAVGRSGSGQYVTGANAGVIASSSNSSGASDGSSSAGIFTSDGGPLLDTAAAVAAASSYHPAEWPRVYGGLAEPHKRIMRRCTGAERSGLLPDT